MKNKIPLSGYAKYSAIGLQMASIIVILALLGRYMDSFKWTKTPIFTILGVFLGVFSAMYYIIKFLIK